MTIVTVTMNPALDLATSVETVKPTVKLRCAAPLVNAGGGGINVARVVRRFGVSVTAIFTAGGVTGERVRDLAAGEGLDVRAVLIAEPTRESITVTQTSDGEQFRFVLPGPQIAPAEERAVLEAVAACGTAKFVVHSGSLPPGTSPAFLSTLAAEASQMGARLVIDGPGDVLSGVRGAYLLKPNLGELETMAGRALPSRNDQVGFARSVIASGIAENLLVSLGEDGALLVTRKEATAYRAPRVTLVSAVGAGDSMVGALLTALASDAPLGDAVAHGVAAGTAALLTPGTELCDPAQSMRLYDEVDRQSVEAAPLAPASLSQE